MVSSISFHLNSQFEERETRLIESLDLVRDIQSHVIDFELSNKSDVEKVTQVSSLKDFREQIPVLKKKLMKEGLGQKYFNESRDLNISFQQYLHQLDGVETASVLAARKIKREFEEVEKELYIEVKKVSLEKILWGAGGDFVLVLLALLGGVALAVILKDDLKQLRNSNKNLRAKLEANKDGLSGGDWSIDLESLNMELGTEALDILNMNVYEQVVSFKNFLDYLTEETARELREQIQLCSKEGDRFSVEVQKRNMGEDKTWVKISGAVVIDQQGNKIVGRISDIDQFRQSEERFNLLFSHISQPAFISGENGLWDCNKAALRFFNLRNKEDFLDKKLAELYPLNQPDGRGSLKYLKYHMRKSQQEERHRFGWTFRHKKGETAAEVQLFPIAINGNPLYLHVLKEDSRQISVVKGREFRAIVCDPNVHSRNILMNYFEEEGWNVEGIGNMVDALSVKEEHFFDIIVVDFSIPDLNLELFRLNQNNTHLVGMGSGKEDELHRSKVDSFISKPIMKEIVLGLIQKVSESSEKLVVEDVMDLYSAKQETLVSYCNELEIYLDEFSENFEKHLDFDEWDEMRESLMTLQTVSKKFSCRGLSHLFETSFMVLNGRDNSLIRDDHRKVLGAFRELIRNIRAELGNRAA